MNAKMLSTSRNAQLYHGGLAHDFEQKSRARLADLKGESRACMSSFSPDGVIDAETSKNKSQADSTKAETQVDVEDGTRDIPISRRGRTSSKAGEVPVVDAGSDDLRQLPMDALRRRARAIGVALPRSCTHAVACQILLDAESAVAQEMRAVKTVEEKSGAPASTSSTKELTPIAAQQISASASEAVVEVDLVDNAMESVAATSQACR